MQDADTQFGQAARAAIRSLQALVDEHPRGNHRLDQLVTDLHNVFLRYLKGAKCCRCQARAPLPEIIHEIFCTAECEAHHENRKFDAARQLQEALDQYEDDAK